MSAEVFGPIVGKGLGITVLKSQNSEVEILVHRWVKPDVLVYFTGSCSAQHFVWRRMNSGAKLQPFFLRILHYILFFALVSHSKSGRTWTLHRSYAS